MTISNCSVLFTPDCYLNTLRITLQRCIILNISNCVCEHFSKDTFWPFYVMFYEMITFLSEKYLSGSHIGRCSITVALTILSILDSMCSAKPSPFSLDTDQIKWKIQGKRTFLVQAAGLFDRLRDNVIAIS